MCSLTRLSSTTASYLATFETSRIDEGECDYRGAGHARSVPCAAEIRTLYGIMKTDTWLLMRHSWWAFRTTIGRWSRVISFEASRTAAIRAGGRTTDLPEVEHLNDIIELLFAACVRPASKPPP
jgi:hypothetical protein